MIGMQMGIDRLDQLEIELAQELAIAVGFFQHRIEDQRLAAGAAREQIAVGAGYAVEKLAKNHCRSFSNASGHYRIIRFWPYRALALSSWNLEIPGSALRAAPE